MTSVLRCLPAWLLLAAISASHAITITDSNSYGAGPSGQLIANGASFSDTWSLLPHGYAPGTNTITSAHASFTLFDNNSSNFYSISLDTSALVSGSNFSGAFNFGHSIIGISLGNLSSSGILRYTITNTSSAAALAAGPQFRLRMATLTAEVDQVVGVPEYGATAPLLGIGIVGIAALRARRRWRRLG